MANQFNQQTPGPDWTGLADDFTASNGTVVKVVTQEARLVELGAMFRNALEVMASRFANLCREGETQIVEVLDSDGMAIGNAEVRIKASGKAGFSTGMIALQNGPAPEAAQVAGEEWLQAVNERTIEMAYDIMDRVFVLREPDATPRP